MAIKMEKERESCLFVSFTVEKMQEKWIRERSSCLKRHSMKHLQRLLDDEEEDFA